jgi:hypothetical protein
MPQMPSTVELVNGSKYNLNVPVAEFVVAWHEATRTGQLLKRPIMDLYKKPITERDYWVAPTAVVEVTDWSRVS